MRIRMKLTKYSNKHILQKAWIINGKDKLIKELTEVEKC